MWRVMIVDDEPSILDGLEQILPWEEYGLELSARATSGEQALELLKAGSVHILLSDIQMPNMSGLELIEKARELDRNLHAIILTAHDAFDYVKRAIRLGVENYLLKPINRIELSETLLKTIENLQREQLDAFGHVDRETFRVNILNRWVSNSIQPHELEDRAELVNIDLQAGEYLAVAVKCLDPVSKDMRTAAAILAPPILSHFPGESFLNPFGDVILLLHGKHLQEKVAYLESLVVEGLAGFHAVSGLSTFAAIGKVVSDAEQVPESYQSAVTLLSYSMLKPANTVISYTPTTSTVSLDFDMPSLERHFLDGNCDEVIPAIKNFLLILSKSTAHHLPEAKFLVLDMLFRMMQQARRIPRNVAAVPDVLKNLFATFETIGTFEQLQTWLISVYATLAEFSRRQQQDQNPLLRTILCHLASHYADDLSLKGLSKRYNINASYLGQLFKNETGELFSVRLNNLRMDKAEELLRTTNAKVGDISLLVGYNNISYFNHNFKNRYGVTPVQYRQG